MTHAQGRRTDKIKVACRQTVGRENALWPWHWSSCRSRHGGRDSVFATSPSSLLATEINKALCWMRTAKLFFLAQTLAKPALCLSEIFHLSSARGSQEFYVCYNWWRTIACSEHSFVTRVVTEHWTVEETWGNCVITSAISDAVCRVVRMIESSTVEWNNRDK